MSGSLIGGKRRKAYPGDRVSHVGIITHIRLPRDVAALLKKEARKAKIAYASYLGRLIIHRNSAVRLAPDVWPRVDSYAERIDVSREEAVNRLLKVALGYVDE